MSVRLGAVAESGVRRLGPLPRRVVFNSARPLSADAQRVFLTSKARAGRRSDIVVDNVVSREGQGGVPEGKAHDWYRITNLSADEADILIYDEISWFGVAAEEFVSELREVKASQLNVRINSPGGSVFDGITIANAIMAHPANVTVYVDGLAASIASVIALAGDRVVMMPRSQFMIHDASGLCIGNAQDMRDMVDLLDKQSDNIAGAYADRAGGTPEEWRARMKAETWYSAEEAVAAGLADEVAEPRKRREEAPEEQPVPAMRQEQLIRAAFRYRDREHAPAPVLQAMAIVETPTEQPAVEDTASGVHHTATENSAWDGPGAVAAMPNDAAVLRYCHAWRDPDGDPDAKATYKFPHHHKDGGPANLAAVRNGLARLSSADIPEAERAAVEAHLRAHLNDGNDDTEDHVSAAPETAADPDPWTALTAHLHEPAPDPWAALVAHLTDNTTSSSAATSTHA